MEEGTKNGIGVFILGVKVELFIITSVSLGGHIHLILDWKLEV